MTHKKCFICSYIFYSYYYIATNINNFIDH